MSYLKAFGLSVLLLLTACTVFNQTHYASNDKNQYLKSKNGENLVVPKPLVTTNMSDFYNLPMASPHARVSIVPPK